MAVEQREAVEVEGSKKGRHRKKQLYSSIMQQMEFYFSDSNLTKDRFLSKLISENPCKYQCFNTEQSFSTLNMVIVYRY